MEYIVLIFFIQIYWLLGKLFWGMEDIKDRGCCCGILEEEEEILWLRLGEGGG